MTLPRNREDSERMLRTAAVEKLRQAGITVNRFRQNPQGIADAIRQIEPKFDRTNTPMSIIRAYLGVGPSVSTEPARLLSTGRAYRSDAQMHAVMDRLRDMPKPMILSSRVPLTSMDSR